jgi:hypothetical protein
MLPLYSIYIFITKAKPDSKFLIEYKPGKSVIVKRIGSDKLFIDVETFSRLKENLTIFSMRNTLKSILIIPRSEE